MTEGFQDEEGVVVDITRGGAPSVSVEDVAKMLWLEGFAYPRERGTDLRMHHAVVTRKMIEAVLENLYQVDVQAIMVIRYLRQVGLIQHADALHVEGGPMVFRYVCARAARDKEPKSIEDVDALIKAIAGVVAFLGPRPEDPRDAQVEEQVEAEAQSANIIAGMCANCSRLLNADNKHPDDEFICKNCDPEQ